MVGTTTPGAKASFQVHPTLAQLNQQAQVPSSHQHFSVRTWIHSAFKLYDQAQLARIENRPESAYVALMKFCSVVVEVIPKHTEFSLVQKDPSYIDLRKRVSEAMPSLEGLAKDIENTCASTSDMASDPASAEPEPSGTEAIPTGNTSARIQQFMKQAQQSSSSPSPIAPKPKPRPLGPKKDLHTASNHNHPGQSTSAGASTNLPPSNSIASQSPMYLDLGNKGLYAELLRAKANSASSRSSSVASQGSSTNETLLPHPIQSLLNRAPSNTTTPATPTDGHEAATTLATDSSTTATMSVPVRPTATPATLPSPITMFTDDIPLPPSPPPELILPQLGEDMHPSLSQPSVEPISHLMPPSTTTLTFPLTTVISPDELYHYLTLTPSSRRPAILIVDLRPPAAFNACRVNHRHMVHILPDWLKHSPRSVAYIEQQLQLRSSKEAADWFRQRDKFDLVMFFSATTPAVRKGQEHFPSPLPPPLIPSPEVPSSAANDMTKAEDVNRIFFELVYEKAFACLLKRMPVGLLGGFAAWRQFVATTPQVPRNMVLPALLPSQQASLGTQRPNLQDNGRSGAADTSNIHKSIYDYLKHKEGPKPPQIPTATESSPPPPSTPTATGLAASHHASNPHLSQSYPKTSSQYSYTSLGREDLGRPRVPKKPGTTSHLTVNTEHPPPTPDGGGLSPVYSADLPSAVLNRMYGVNAVTPTKPSDGTNQRPMGSPTNAPATTTPTQMTFTNSQPTPTATTSHGASQLHRRRSVFDNPYYGFTHTPSDGSGPATTRYPSLSPRQPTAGKGQLPISTSPAHSSPAANNMSTATVQPAVSRPASTAAPIPEHILPSTAVPSIPSHAPMTKPMKGATAPIAATSSSYGSESPALPPKVPTPSWKPTMPPPPIPRTRPSPMPPTAPPSIGVAAPAMSNQLVNIGTTGLRNFGNTCFMNSIVQCLSATIPLARYFMDGSYKRHLVRDNPLGTKGVLSESFAVLIRTMWSGQYSVVSPVGFREAIGRFAPQFKGDDQHDSQELLNFLLDGLHEDLNLAYQQCRSLPSQPKHPLDTMSDEAWEALPAAQAASLAWEKHLLRNASVIVGLFQGQLQSRLCCLRCKRTSTTYTPFMTLSVPIPVPPGQGQQQTTLPVTLHQCLAHFAQREILDGDDRWHCPRCKSPQRTSKQLTITRLPDVLLVHLKRFSFQGPFRNKLETMVHFPVHDLDMSRYTLPTAMGMPGSAEAMTATAHTDTTRQQSSSAFMYDLYGVSSHMGGLSGGHYTACVRNGFRGKWYTFDDSRVFECDESRVVTQAAYNLFYVRNNVA
ncbi:ubiquitin-specific protease doa4 [Dimargaris verticillata]|uniref:ubiquitinyl hydrolase 1 n=1 Tax=Dimargaris verticillata TaxID=2761393 RepID=A0A9W8BBH0_9FUNG|nr:ubiquitin-specific protease doa4 [Dimargaris verticillata]